MDGRALKTDSAVEDGDARLEVWTVGKGRYRVVLRNLAPCGWVGVSWAGTRPLEVRSVVVYCEDSIEPRYWQLRECRRIDGGWVLLDGAMRRDPHARIASSEQCLQGGTAIAWDLAPPGLLVPPQNREVEARITRTRRMRRDLPPGLAGERLAYLRGLQTASAASLDIRSTRRDLGWLMLHWAGRFSGGRLPEAVGPWAWGSLLGADGHRNWSYDAIGAAVDQFVRTHDPLAWEIAYVATVHKVHQGLFRSRSGDPNHGRWAYEKGANPGRPGDYRGPEASHEWDFGPLAVALLSGDPELLACMADRREGLLATLMPTVRNFGARLRGWHLHSLRMWSGMTGDAAFLAKAQTVHDGIWSTVLPGEIWLRNDPYRKVPITPEWAIVDPWQQALLFGEMSKFEGLRLDPRFDAFARNTLEAGTWTVATNYGPALAGGYTLNLLDGTRTAPWPSTTAFFLPLLDRYRDDYPDKVAQAMTAALAMIPASGAWDLPLAIPLAELQMDYSRGGPHGAKSHHQTLEAFDDEDLR